MADKKSLKTTSFHTDSAGKVSPSRKLPQNMSQSQRNVSPRTVPPKRLSHSKSPERMSPHKSFHSKSPKRMSPHKSFSKLSHSKSPRKMSPLAKSYHRKSSRSKSPRRISPYNRSHRRNSRSKSPKQTSSRMRKSVTRSPERFSYQQRKLPRRGNSLGRYSRRSLSRKRSLTRCFSRGRSSDRRSFRSISPRASNRRPFRSISPKSSNRRPFRSISPGRRNHSRSRSLERIPVKNKSFNKRFSRSRSQDRKSKSSYSVASGSRKNSKLRSHSRSPSFSLSVSRSRSPSPRYWASRRSRSRSRHSRSVSPASPIDKSWLFESGDWLDKTASFISAIQKSTNKNNKGPAIATNPRKAEPVDLQMVAHQKEVDVFLQGPPPCIPPHQYCSSATTPLSVPGAVPNNLSYQGAQDSFHPPILHPQMPGSHLTALINPDANVALQLPYNIHLPSDHHKLPISLIQQPPPPLPQNIPTSDEQAFVTLPHPLSSLIRPPLQCQPPLPDCPFSLEAIKPPTLPPYLKHIPPPPINNPNQVPPIKHLSQPPLPQSPPPLPPPLPLHGPTSPVPYDTHSSLTLDIPSIPLPPSKISMPATVISVTTLSSLSSSTATQSHIPSLHSVSVVPEPPPAPVISNMLETDTLKADAVQAARNSISTTEENYNVVEMELYSPGHSSDDEDYGCLTNIQSTSDNFKDSIKNRLLVNANTDEPKMSPFISSLQSKLKNILPNKGRLLNKKRDLNVTTFSKPDSSEESLNGTDMYESNELDDEFVALKLCKNNTYLSYGQSSEVQNSSNSPSNTCVASERKNEVLEIPSSDSIANIRDQVYNLENSVRRLLQNQKFFDLTVQVTQNMHDNLRSVDPKSTKCLLSSLVDSFSFKNPLLYSSKPENSHYSEGCEGAIPNISRSHSPSSATSCHQKIYDHISPEYFDPDSYDTISHAYDNRSTATAQVTQTPVSFRPSSQEMSPVSSNFQSSSPAHAPDYIQKYDSSSKYSSLYRRRSTPTSQVSIPTSPIIIPTSPVDIQFSSHETMSPSFPARTPDYMTNYDSSSKKFSVYQRRSSTTAKVTSPVLKPTSPVSKPTSPVLKPTSPVNFQTPSQEIMSPSSPKHVPDYMKKYDSSYKHTSIYRRRSTNTSTSGNLQSSQEIRSPSSPLHAPDYMKKYDPNPKHTSIYRRRSTTTPQVTSIPTSPGNSQSSSQETVSLLSPARVPDYMKKYNNSPKQSSLSLSSSSHNTFEDEAYKMQKDVSHSFKSASTEIFEKSYGVCESIPSESHESRSPYAIESSLPKQNKATHLQKKSGKIVSSSRQQNTEDVNSSIVQKNSHVHSRINRWSFDDHQMSQHQSTPKVSVDNKSYTRTSLSSLDDDDNNKYNTAGCRMQDVMQYIRQKLESDLRESSVTSRVYKPVLNPLPIITNLDTEISSVLNPVVPEVVEINEEIKTPIAEFSDDSQSSVVCLDPNMDSHLSDSTKEPDKNTKKARPAGSDVDKISKKKKSTKHPESCKPAQMTNSEVNKHIGEGTIHKSKESDKNNKRAKQSKIYDESAEMLFSVNTELPVLITNIAPTDGKAINNVSSTKVTEKMSSKTRKQAAPKRWSTVCPKSAQITQASDSDAQVEKNKPTENLLPTVVNENKTSSTEPVKKTFETNEQCPMLAKNNLKLDSKKISKPEVIHSKVSLGNKKSSDNNKLIPENKTSGFETQTKSATKKTNENLAIKPVIILTDVTLDKTVTESEKFQTNKNSQIKKIDKKKSTHTKIVLDNKNDNNVENIDFNISNENKKADKNTSVTVNMILDEENISKMEDTGLHTARGSKKAEEQKKDIQIQRVSDNDDNTKGDTNTTKKTKSNDKKKKKSLNNKNISKKEHHLSTVKEKKITEKKKNSLIHRTSSDCNIDHNTKDSFHTVGKSKKTNEKKDTQIYSISYGDNNKKRIIFLTDEESKKASKTKTKITNIEKTDKETNSKELLVTVNEKVDVKEDNLSQAVFNNEKTAAKEVTSSSTRNKGTSKVEDDQINLVSNKKTSNKKRSDLHKTSKGNESDDKANNQSQIFTESKTGKEDAIQSPENTSRNKEQKRIILHMKKTMNKKTGGEESSLTDSSMWEALSETLPPNCTTSTSLYRKHVSVLKSIVGNLRKHKLTRNDYKLRWIPTIRLSREDLKCKSTMCKDKKSPMNTSASSDDLKVKKVSKNLHSMENRKRTNINSKEIELVEISDSSNDSECETVNNTCQELSSHDSSSDVEIISSTLNVKTHHKKLKDSSTKDKTMSKYVKQRRITESEESSSGVEIVSPSSKQRRLKNKLIESSSSEDEAVTKPSKYKRLENQLDGASSDVEIVPPKQRVIAKKSIKSSSEDEIETTPLKKGRLKYVPEESSSEDEIVLKPLKRRRLKKEPKDSSSEDDSVTKCLKRRRLNKLPVSEESSSENEILPEPSKKRPKRESDNSSSEDEILCLAAVKKILQKRAELVTSIATKVPPYDGDDNNEPKNLELPFVEVEVYKHIISLLSVDKRSVSIQVSPTNKKNLSGSINVQSENSVKNLYVDIIENLKNLVTSLQKK